MKKDNNKYREWDLQISWVNAVRVTTWVHTSKFPFTSKIAPNFMLVISQKFLESWHGITQKRTLIKIALSHQNCIPFRFSYHEDHRAGYHAECLNRWNDITPQKNSTFCNNMIFICSLIMPRYSMATANHLLVYYSEE
jgi:hypothetical protein